MRLVKALALAALLLVPTLSFAGEIHPALAERMDAAPADEAIKIIVTMTEQAPIAELNQSLKQERASLERRHREVILSLQDVSRSQTALRSWLDLQLASGAVRGYTPHWIANLIVVSATPGAIAAIAARPDVAFVELDFKPELIAPVLRPSQDSELGEAGTRGIGVTPGLRALNAPQVWYELGITGAGRLVANLDTGVDGNHPALASRWRGNHAPASECWLDVLGGYPAPRRRQRPRHPRHGHHDRSGPRRHHRRGAGRRVDRLQRHRPGRGQRLRQRHHRLLPVVRRSRRQPLHRR